MKYTDNLNLKKPEQTEFYDVDDFNANADILDAEVQAIKDGYLPLTGGTMSGDIDTSINRLCLKAGTSPLIGKGSAIHLFRDDSETSAGMFHIMAGSSNGEYKYLKGSHDGALTWNNKNIVRSIDGLNADINGNINLSNVRMLINENTFRNKALAGAMVNIISTLFVEVFGDTTDVNTSAGDGATAISKYFKADTHVFEKTDSATVTIYSKAKTVTSGNNTAWVYGDYTLNGGSIEFAISRDGGTTYTVLTDKTATSISGQPTGSSMIMRVKMTGALIFNNIAWGCKA